MFVRPAPDPERPGQRLKVRVPHTFALLPDAGQEVPETLFWHQRLLQGDVVLPDLPDAIVVEPVA